MSYYRSLIKTDPYSLNQIAYFPFDTNAINVLDGQIGTSANITYGTPVKIGSGSAGFNGTSSLITVTDSDIYTFGTGSFSINMWIYINPTGVAGLLINKRDNTPLIEYQLSYTLTTLTFNIYSGGTTANTVGKVFNQVLATSVWQMITITSSGGTGTTARAGLKCYLNGIEITAFANLGSGTYAGMANTSAGVVFGRQGNIAAGYHNGRLDQAKIWKGRELNATEVLDIYNTLY